MKTGLSCDLDVDIPLNTETVFPLLTVHYAHGIRISGNELHQMFVKRNGDINYKLLECTHYDFHKDLMPSCEVIPVEKKCNDALLKNDISLVIKKCNFTEDQPPLFERTMTGGLLFQGEKLSILEERDGGFFPIIAIPPVVILTSNTLKVTNEKEEIIIKPLLTNVATQILKSKLTQKEIDKLVSRLYWINFFKNLKEEDVADILLLLSQIALIPITLLGIVITIHRKRKEILNMIKAKKSKRKIYKENRESLLAMRPN